MCNLYRMTKTPAEVAAWFDAVEATGGANFGAEVYPGYPGLVVAAGEVRRMTWGFPLVLKGKQGQPSERFSPIPTHRDGADFGPLQGGGAQEYVDISSPADAAAGQKGPALEGLPGAAPWQRRHPRPGTQPALRASPPHAAAPGNRGRSEWVKTALKPKPVNNARSDKLDTFFWRHSFTERRCLIPLTGWAEAQGPRGRMTRTWLSLPGEDLFAAAGVWRHSDEWGACYSMVMTGSAGAVAEVHERMPVLLSRDDWAGWTDGSPEQAMGLCEAWAGEVLIDRTAQPWAGGAVQPGLL